MKTSNKKSMQQQQRQRNSSLKNITFKNQYLCISLLIILIGLISILIVSSQNMYKHRNPTISAQQTAYQYLVNSLGVKEQQSMKNIQLNFTQYFHFAFRQTVQRIVDSDLNSIYKRGRKMYSIDRETHRREILMEGVMQQMSAEMVGQQKQRKSQKQRQTDSSVQTSKRTKKNQIIKKVLQQQRLYLQHKYKLSKYEKQQLRFCIIVVENYHYDGYSKQSIISSTLSSIFLQNYSNYHVVYYTNKGNDLNNNNNNQTIIIQQTLLIKQLLTKYNISQEKIKIINNSIRKPTLQLIYESIVQKQYCNDGEIVIILQLGDKLLGINVLNLYNAIYQMYRVGMVYSTYLTQQKYKNRQQQDDQEDQEDNKQQRRIKRTFIIPSFPVDNKLLNQTRSIQFPLLKGKQFISFYTNIFKSIKKEDLTYNNGSFFNSNTHYQVLIIPLIQLCGKRSYYLPELLVYQAMVQQYKQSSSLLTKMKSIWDEYIRGVSDKQNQMGFRTLRERPKYSTLKQFDFIDKNQRISKLQERPVDTYF